MNYRLPFFTTQIFLLVLVGISRYQQALSHVRARKMYEWDLYCPYDWENGATFLVLFLLLANQFLLWRHIKSKLLWWLNCTGMITLFYLFNPWGNPDLLLMWSITATMGALHFRERFSQAERPPGAIAAGIVLAVAISMPLWFFLIDVVSIL
ncbi:MAG: hypothetical protein AAF597_09485 [Bacteroidota bacterium]